MKRYSIHTQNKDAKWIERLLSFGFDGYTIVKADGFWKGAREKSLEIIIYTSNTRLIRQIAEQIKHHNKQEAVFIAETECKIELV